MLFAGLGSVRIVKNCDRVLEKAASSTQYQLIAKCMQKGHLIKSRHLLGRVQPGKPGQQECRRSQPRGTEYASEHQLVC